MDTFVWISWIYLFEHFGCICLNMFDIFVSICGIYLFEHFGYFCLYSLIYLFEYIHICWIYLFKYFGYSFLNSLDIFVWICWIYLWRHIVWGGSDCEIALILCQAENEIFSVLSYNKFSALSSFIFRGNNSTYNISQDQHLDLDYRFRN